MRGWAASGPGMLANSQTITARVENETYKRSHRGNQIDDGVKPVWTGYFLVTDLLADGEISQSKEFEVGIVSVIALHHTLSAHIIFMEHPSRKQQVARRPDH